MDMLSHLTKLYCEPHRAYHTLSHIGYMFDNAPPMVLTPNQVMAIWFHDAVYQPGAHDNEAKSAKLAQWHIAGNPADGLDADVVSTIIMDTRTHEPSIEESKLVLDLDLLVLASAAYRYRRYTVQIRKEYAAIPEPAYRAGRAAFLRKMLERPRLYHVLDGFEATARANLKCEIAGLEPT